MYALLQNWTRTKEYVEQGDREGDTTLDKC